MSHSLRAAVMAALIALLTAAAPARAEDPPDLLAEAPVELDAPPGPPKFIFGTLSTEFTTQYFKRGILLEDRGAIAQPMFNLIVGAYQSDTGPLNQLAFLVGTRQSVHDRKTAAGRRPEQWFEADLYGGFSAKVLDRFRFDTTYVAILSPSDAFDSIQEIDLQLTFLDDGLLGELTVHPYVLFVRELRGSALNGPEGSYLEFGLEPSFPLIRGGPLPVTLSFPTRFGMSLSEYYQLPTPFGFTLPDETCGFTQTGVSVAVPLACVPPKYGALILSAGVDFLFLHSDNLALINGRRTAIIGRIGLTWAF